MTKERVESIRKIDYEGLGESDAKEFTNDFNEILNLAEDAIEQDCISRKFEEIVVEYPPADLCIYPEYKGKPYFSIKYEENGKHIIGFGTYNPEVLTSYLQEYFISDIQPKTGHWIEDAGTYYKAIHERGCEPDENTPIFLDDIACSECLTKFSVIDNETERFECCPHCGAKMVEPQESEDKE